MERALTRAVGSTYLVGDVLGLERLLLGGGELFRCQRKAVLLGQRPGELLRSDVSALEQQLPEEASVATL